MLGQAYLMQRKFGMSRVHLKRALVLNPGHAIATKYLDRLNTLAKKAKASSTPVPPAPSAADKNWLGRIFHR